MANIPLTVEDILFNEGFVNFSSDIQKTQNTNHTNNKYDKNTIYEILHKDNPIVKLKEFGIYHDKNNIKYEKLEYTNIYDIDNEKNYARYLMSRTYVIEKVVTNNITTLDDKDISFNCPLYYLIVTDMNNNIINDSLYTVKLVFPSEYFSECNNLIVKFSDGYVCDNNQDFYDMFGKNKTKIYNDVIRINHKKQRIFNNYTDRIEIIFDDMTCLNSIKIECKVYDIYGYGGFFISGWLFN